MIHINNRSDFSTVWKMPNGGILPTFPYTLEFSTRGGLRYAVKSDDATRFIPKPDADGQIRSAVIVFDFSNRPHLPSGRLSFTMKAAIPNTMYPDDYQDITEPHPTNAELWDGATDYKDAIEVELVLPYVKGDKGDAGEGVPAGGRTGQVLKKKSDGDYDTTWGDDEGITDIAPGAVGTKEIAEKAVTLPKLGDDVAAKLNGYASKEDVVAVANVATSAASAAADAQTSADDAAKAAIAAGCIAQTAKETAESAQTAADGAVRYDAAQELTVEQMEQVFGNLGLKVVYIAEAEFGTVLNTKRFDEILATDIAITEYQGKEYIFMTGNDTAPNERYYTSPFSPMLFLRFYISYRTKVLASPYLQRIVDTGAVSYLDVQTLTSAQQTKGRTNIAAMANTPSGDPMHYIYETAGAEWIPYADISTEGLEDWQVETLNRAQAQADGGVWWHNDIFVTVEQNRINYMLTIGQYPSQLNTYDLYLGESFATTNYKDKHAGFYTLTANDALRFCKCVTVYFPNVSLQSAVRFCQLASNIRRILGVVNIAQISQPNGLISAFHECPNLEDVSIKGINANLNLSKCPNLRTSSIIYMITNAGTATLTITLAPAVYAAAVADADVQAALAAKPNVTLADAGATSSGGN